MNITLQRIKELQKKKKINIKELCAALEITRTAYAAWYTADRLPSSAAIIQLAKLFNVTSDYLLGISDSANSNTSTEIKMLLESVKGLDMTDIVDIISYAGYVKLKKEKHGRELV